MVQSLYTQIRNIEMEICSREIQAAHPELFHYTKRVPFQNIVTSNKFWASHFRDMVDQTEVQILRTRLPPAIAPHFEQIAAEYPTNRTGRRLWKKGGGGLGLARDFVDSLYGATFDGRSDLTATEAYMTSFSTHAADTDFDRENGVWSQWRDYAGPDGYCIVLDTAGLARMLGQEWDSRYWVHLKLDAVRYADLPDDQLFPELVRASANTLRAFLFNKIKYPEMATQPFLLGATLLKEAKYRPEREVRIVGMPGTQRMSDQALKEFPDSFQAQPLPEIRKRPDTNKRYVTIFEKMNAKLPIKRVIVGPAAGQEERAEFVRSLLRDTPIVCSRCTMEIAKAVA